jgi:hypothetical protein
MNLRYRNMVISMATLRGEPQKRSIPEVKDKRWTIPLERKLAVRRTLLAAELVLILKEDRRRQKLPKGHKFEEFRNAKPPSFDDEIKKGDEVEAWQLGLKKYFRTHEFSENLKARVATFKLNEKASIWWEDLKNVKGIHE